MDDSLECMQNMCTSFNVAHFLSILHQVRLLYYHLLKRLHKVHHICVDRKEKKEYYSQVGAARPKSQIMYMEDLIK